MFHAGTRPSDDGKAVMTAGGRTLTVVGRGSSLPEARERAYGNIEKISFTGGFYRRDIAARTGVA